MSARNPPTHESYERKDKATRSSDRSFCYTFAVVALIFAVISFWKSGNLWPWLGGFAAVFAAVGLIAPSLFAPLNKLWFKLGMMLHKIMTPLIMGVVFFAVITPVAMLMRLFGKHPLDLEYDPDAPSYWIERKPSGPRPDSIKHQF